MGIELAKAFVRIRGDSSGLQGDLQQVEEQVDNSISKMQVAAAAFLSATAAAGVSFFRGGFQEAATFEQTTIAFETMLGSADETKKTLADLTDFAALTPFEMPGILQAARGLIQFGERGDDIVDTMEIIGNAASGTSTDFGFLALVFNQVRGVGKLLTQDFRQLSTRGVLSLQDIADHYGVTTAEAQKMLSSGKVSFEDFKKILGGLSDEGGRFHNMMAKQAESMLGLISTLKDAWNILARVLSQNLLPPVKALVKVLIVVVEKVMTMSGEMGPILSRSIQLGVAFAVMGATLTAAGVAAQFFGVSIKAALIGTGFGALLVIAGMALGALIGWYESLMDSGKEASKVLKEVTAEEKNAMAAANNLKESLIMAGDIRTVADEVKGLAPAFEAPVNAVLKLAARIRDLREPIATGAFGDAAEGAKMLEGVWFEFFDKWPGMMVAMGKSMALERPVDALLEALAKVKDQSDQLEDSFLHGLTQPLEDAIGRMSGVTDEIARANLELAKMNGRVDDIDIQVAGAKARGATEDQQEELEFALRRIEKKKKALEDSKKADKNADAMRGSFSFEGLGSRLQDLFLKEDKDALAKKRIGLAERQVDLAEQQLAATRSNTGKPGVLADTEGMA